MAGGPDPALALYRLEQHRRHLGRDRVVEGSDILPRDVAKALGKRLERFVFGRLPGGVQRSQGAPVERPIGAHYDVTAMTAPFPGQFDGALVGLGATVGEKDLAAPADEPVQSGRHFLTGLCPEEVGGVQQRFRGVADRLRYDGVSVAGEVTASPERKSRYRRPSSSQR